MNELIFDPAFYGFETCTPCPTENLGDDQEMGQEILWQYSCCLLNTGNIQQCTVRVWNLEERAPETIVI